MESTQSYVSETNNGKNGLIALIACDLLILAALIFTSPLKTIAIALILFLSAFFILSHRGYLYFLLIWLPYEGLVLPEEENIRLLRLIAISIIIILGWTKFLLSGQALKFPHKYVTLPIIMVLSWSAIAAFLSPSPLWAMFDFVKSIAYFAIFILVYNIIASRQDLKRLLLFLFIISLPIYIAALYQYFQMGFLRVWGVFGNPNTLGLYSFTTAALALIYRETARKTYPGRIIFTSWFILSVMALVLSGSRASVLGMAVFTAVYLIYKRRFILLAILALGGAMGVYYIISSQVLFFDFAQTIRLASGLTGRTIIWDTAWELIKDYPLFGVGPGNVPLFLYNYAQATHPIVTLDLHSAMERGLTHNGYLQIWAEIGIIGLIIVLWAIYRFMRYLYRIMRVSKDHYLGKISMVVIALLIGRLVHSLFESDLDIGPFTLEMSAMLIYISVIKLSVIKSMNGKTQ